MSADLQSNFNRYYRNVREEDRPKYSGEYWSEMVKEKMKEEEAQKHPDPNMRYVDI